VQTQLTYLGAMTQRPRYYAVNSARNRITRDRRTVRIENARRWARAPTLDQEGFALLPHKSATNDFRDSEELASVYVPEMRRLVKEVSGADEVVIWDPTVLRFSKGAPTAPNIMRPGRFVHIDVSDSDAAVLTDQWRPRNNSRAVRRFAYYNTWRVFSPPPQDVPLAVCDARCVSRSDLVDADSVSDLPCRPESSSIVVLVRYSSNHRWSHFADMCRDEVLLFKSYDTDPDQPQHVPHSAFANTTCGPGAAPRASIEVRAIAFWFER
jgi:hypothetical protein